MRKSASPEPREIAFSQVKHDMARPEAKVCPECGHAFRDNGWDGIDSHWKAKHGKIMPYDEAWPLLKAGTYTKADTRTQSEKLEAAARDLGCDPEEDRFKDVLRKLAKPKV